MVYMKSNMENIISRHCIHPDMLLHEHDVETGKLIKIHTRDDFCELINRWKVYLVDKYNVQPGQTLGMELSPGLLYYALIFAAAELGLTFIIDWPFCYSERDINDPKVSMWGQIDYVVINSQDQMLDRPWTEWTHARNLKYSKTLIYEDKLFEYDINQCQRFDEISNTIWATPATPLANFPSSGTTGLPKKLMNTHEKVYKMSKRLTGINFLNGLRVLNFNNLNHGASMTYHFLPSFISGSELFTAAGVNGPNEFGIDNVLRFSIENKINQVFLYRTDYVEYFLKNMPRLEYTFNIMTMWQITPEMIELVKEKNINWIRSPFGDTSIGTGILVKHVDQSTDLTTYDITNQGPKLDDFYQVEIRDGHLWVACPDLDQDWRSSGDVFEEINGEFYFKGRANQYLINGERVKLGPLEVAVSEAFGADGANIVVDPEMQKIYLAVWKSNSVAEAELNKFFADKYTRIKVDYVLRDEQYCSFHNGRKIDNSKIREVCREKILKGELNEEVISNSIDVSGHSSYSPDISKQAS